MEKWMSATAPGEQIIARLARMLLGLPRWQKRFIVLLSDMSLCALAVWLAFSIRLSVWMPLTPPLLAFTGIVLVIFPLIFSLAGTYRHIFRFAGSGTIMQLASAIVLVSIPMLMIFTLYQVNGVPRTVAILHPILFFILASVSRIVARYVLVDVLGARVRAGQISRCIIYGAGTSGQQLQASMARDPAFVVVAFADDDARLHRQRLNGVPVYHSAHIVSIVKTQAIDTIFIAMPHITRTRRKEVIEGLSGLNLRVQILPSVAELVDGKVSISDLREIRVADLLGRDPVQPNEILLASIVRGKTVLVTGAGGSIGSELCRQLREAGPVRLLLAEISEPALYKIENELRNREGNDRCEIVPTLTNLADEAQARRLCEQWRPDTVFHAAAYKHVPLVEANVISGLRNNVLGTRNAAIAARDNGASHFVLVSTDKAVRPTNVMGATKRICELVLQAMAMEDSQTKFSMVRFGNVLGSSGSVVPEFQRQIRAGGPVRLTHRDMTRFFMTIPEAAQLVIQAGAMARGGEVFLLDMGDPVRIYDLARSMIELSGATVRDTDNPDGDIEIVEIGLRPGEKLYEELLIDSTSEPTRHEKIMQARENAIPPKKLTPAIAELEVALQAGDKNAALAVMRRLVPEYAPYERAEVRDYAGLADV